MTIPRIYSNLDTYCTPGKALLLFGPRQVGKTTLVTEFLKKTPLKYKLDSGDNIQVQEILRSQRFDIILPYVSGYDLYVIDEAQLVPNIGMALKIMVDQLPNLRIIATGSSSFELAGQTGEPLTGRKKTITLYPVSAIELSTEYNHHELMQQHETQLIYGSYPAVLTAPTSQKKEEELRELVASNLLKDVLAFQEVKSAGILLDLLRLIAFQIGGEVSLSELGSSLGIDYKTVARYLDLFEKAFILYQLRGYSRNLRNEITKKHKYYFFDNGIRNAIISNFNPVAMRDDVGKLWENYMVTERLKMQEYTNLSANNYFWRTWEKQEVDWVEEREGKLYGYEFKYSPKKPARAPLFLATYQNAELQIINKENFLPFVGVV